MIQSHVSFKFHCSLYAHRGHVVVTIRLKSDEKMASGLKDGSGVTEVVENTRK